MDSQQLEILSALKTEKTIYDLEAILKLPTQLFIIYLKTSEYMGYVIKLQEENTNGDNATYYILSDKGRELLE